MELALVLFLDCDYADLAEAVLGKDINYSRWLDQSEHLAKIFQQYCNVDNKINVTIEQLGSLIAVHAKRKRQH